MRFKICRSSMEPFIDDNGDQRLVVDVETLEELIAFMNKHGDLIVREYEGHLMLEIYDDYRE